MKRYILWISILMLLVVGCGKPSSGMPEETVPQTKEVGYETLNTDSMYYLTIFVIEKEIVDVTSVQVHKLDDKDKEIEEITLSTMHENGRLFGCVVNEEGRYKISVAGTGFETETKIVNVVKENKSYFTIFRWDL